MKIAIMQPYLFPYVGYWQLIANSDKFVFFDVVQYNRKSWMNRNRILHPDNTKDFQYISVPIKKHPKGTLIKDVEINNDENWKEKILGQLTIYKKFNAPNYKQTIKLIEKIFSKNHTDFLSLSIESTKEICNFLKLPINYAISSELSFDRSIIKEADDWALSISRNLEAKQYINPYGGFEIFNEEKYNNHSIDIKFIKPKLIPYNQSYRVDFQSGLSIIDILMFKRKDDVKNMLKNDFHYVNKQQLLDIKINHRSNNGLLP